MHVAAEGSDVHYFLGNYQLNLTVPKPGDYLLYASLSPAFSEPLSLHYTLSTASPEPTVFTFAHF